MPSLTTTTLAFLAAFTGSALAGPIGGLEARQLGGGGGGGSSTRNELVNSSGACKSTIVIFARGTTEPGNVGVVAGPSFFSSLSSKVGGDLLVQGVDYAATWDGALSGGDPTGSRKMADLITKAVSQCPSSNIVISGYSQGAQLVHNAAALLPSGVATKISSAIVFGDPYNGQAVRGIPKLLSICYSDDNICSGGLGASSGTGGHAGYGKEAAKAADFVVKNSIASAPAPAPATAAITTTLAPVVAPTESTVEFPSIEDSFPIASPVVPTLVPTPTDITVEFPSAEDSFPVANPVIPTLVPTPTETTVKFPSTEDSFPITSPVIPTAVPAPIEYPVAFPSTEDSFPTASPVPVPAPAPAPVPGTGAGNGSAFSIKAVIDRWLAAWGKSRPKGN